MSIFNQKLNSGLEKTKTSLFKKISKAVAGKSKVDEAVLDELEEILIAADVGVPMTLKIVENLEARVEKDKYLNISELNILLRQEISTLINTQNHTLAQDFNLKQIKTLDDVEVQMHRAKAYVMRLKRSAKAAETLQEKLDIGQQVKEAERVMRLMRRSVFDIEDAVRQGRPAASLVKH